MISYLKRRLNLLDVVSTSQYVLIRGVDKYGIFKDIGMYWETTVVSKYMFMTSSSSDLKFHHFFLPDILYMFRQLHDAKRSYIPKRYYSMLIELLLEKTWIGEAETQPVKSIINEKVLGSLCPWPLKDYQSSFIKHYGLVVPAYRLQGYMLEAGTGSGKTMTAIEWSNARDHDKLIVLCPPNVTERVWKKHLTELIKIPKRTWVSTEDVPLSTEFDAYVVHFHQIEKVLEFFKVHARDMGKVGLVLDESHHLNRMVADRTQHTVGLSKVPQVTDTLWMSATPIDAIGTECIPFLITADPLFIPEVEERFKKIFGRSAKKANEILRARLGILKYYIPKQEAEQGEPPEYEVRIKLPNGNDYTIAAITQELREFMMERQTYYDRNRESFIKTYDECMALFAKTLSTTELSAYNNYKLYVDMIRKGYDPRAHKDAASYCNLYERKTIIPRLPDKLKAKFREAKSVVKYVHLKVMGEALGKLGTFRVECNIDIAMEADVMSLIDSAEKKTLIFSSYIEVVEKLAERLKKEGYTPVVVHGSTSKSPTELLKTFDHDPDANPLITTFQSLSTGVPLIAANRTLYMNAPFRDRIKKQAAGRTNRLGQDKPVDYYSFFLDTGSEPNISTRSLEIMDWSADQVKSILGVTNLDLVGLSLEWNDSYCDEFMETAEMEQEQLSEEANTHAVGVPPFLYHGSMYKQQELMPGFKRSGVLVKWDVYESNQWLYMSSNKEEAILLGIGSAAEKVLDVVGYKYDAAKQQMTLISESGSLTKKDLEKLDVYVYTVTGRAEDGWIKNVNPNNHIDTEWKTEHTIREAIVKREKVDVRDALVGWTIKFEHK